jgi:hypothetical protein
MGSHGLICRSCGCETDVRAAFEHAGVPTDRFECPACGGHSFGV